MPEPYCFFGLIESPGGREEYLKTVMMPLTCFAM